MIDAEFLLGSGDTSLGPLSVPGHQCSAYTPAPTFHGHQAFSEVYGTLSAELPQPFEPGMR